MVDQNTPHQLGSNPIELSAALPMGRMLANQLEISLVNQSRRLQGVAGQFIPKRDLRPAAEFAVNQR